MSSLDDELARLRADADLNAARETRERARLTDAFQRFSEALVDAESRLRSAGIAPYPMFTTESQLPPPKREKFMGTYGYPLLSGLSLANGNLYDSLLGAYRKAQVVDSIRGWDNIHRSQARLARIAYGDTVIWGAPPFPESRYLFKNELEIYITSRERYMPAMEALGTGVFEQLKRKPS